MLKEGLRITAVFLLILIIIMDDFPFYYKLKDPTIQLFLGLIVLALIFYDTTFGFIMGLVMMLIYYEIYKKIISDHERELELKEKESTTPPKNIYKSNRVCTTKMDYISDAHLLAAQNNVYDVQNFNTEIVGLQNAIGAQGLDKGYDNSNTYAIF
jgi:hypothetical protein